MTTPSVPTPPQNPTPHQPPAQPGTTPPAPSNGTVSGSATLDSIAQTVIGVAKQARTQVGKLTQANRGTITSTLDKVGAAIDRQTGARFHQQVESAKALAHKGVDVVAGAPAPVGQGTSATTPPVTPGTTTAAGTTIGAGTTASPAAPSTPGTTPAAEPKQGWHRGPDGQWVKSS